MNRRRNLLGMFAIYTIDECKIVIDQPGCIGDLQNLAVNARLRVRPLQRRAASRLPIGASPFEFGNLPRRRPRTAAVEHDLLAQRHKMMRPRHRDQLRLPLVQVRFPQKRVAVDDAPFARRLLAADIEMQVRPAAAAAFLAQQPDWVTHPHPLPVCRWL